MSAILSADDLNDFITPGVACIKPIETLPVEAAPDASLENEVVIGAPPTTTAKAGAPAQISLTDCLACSGCVTSAEAVLVGLQSHTEVLNTLDAGPALTLVGPDADDARYTVHGIEHESSRLLVASVSPQTRANLAAMFGNGVTEKQAGRVIEELLLGERGLRSGGKWGNGFAWVVDTNTAREACLVLGADEVLGTSTTPGCEKPIAPILTSSCPGWVCYAEKTHPYVLPHLSRVKSPQALMGTVLKTTLSRTLGIPPDRIWHLAIMPCFDKKLEASRGELTAAAWAGASERAVRDVDCVITTKEILMLAESRGIDLFTLPSIGPELRQPIFPDGHLHQFLFPAGRRSTQSRAAGTSGGNLSFVLQEVQARHPDSQVHMTRGRNADVVEYVVTAGSGETIFKAARYYGFRNIQNLVRKLKPARPSKMPGGKPIGTARRAAGKPLGLDYSYVEVMACPGGCTNGGGQINVDDQIVMDRKGLSSKPGPQERKQWLAEVDEAYFSADEDAQSGDDSGRQAVDGVLSSRVRDSLSHWSDTVGIELRKLAFTSFREVVSDVGKSETTDAQKVVQLASKIGGGW